MVAYIVFRCLQEKKMADKLSPEQQFRYGNAN